LTITAACEDETPGTQLPELPSLPDLPELPNDDE
jgi:hypothetical protein